MNLLRIIIEAQIPEGKYGGVEQFLISLVSSLGRLDDGNEEYLIVSRWDYPNLLKPYLSSSQYIHVTASPKSGPLELFKQSLGPLRKPLGNVWRKLIKKQKPYEYTIPISDGFYESLSAEVLHITYPLHFVKSTIPTIFHIHDLQYRHFPQFSSKSHIEMREKLYNEAFKSSKVLITPSKWVKDDVIKQHNIDSEKIYVVHHSSPTASYKEISEADLKKVKQKYKLKDEFIVYPSLTYEHKNHLRLLDAIAQIREKDNIKIKLVCTGKQELFWPKIKEHYTKLKLQDQVQFLGFIKPEELRAIYKLTKFMVFPSLFEGAGLPLIEAFFEGIPVTCSDISAFREYGKEAVHFFDPNSQESIAGAIKLLNSNPNLRSDLIKKGKGLSNIYNQEKMAKKIRAIYRKVAKRELSEEDKHLLLEASK